GTNGSAIEVRDILTTSEDRVELERYRVFLPLREFEDENLVELGARIARARNAELSLLHVVEIPRNLPPKAIRFRYVDDRIRGLQRLARIGEDLGVDTRPVVKIGHKVYEIILDTIREEAVNLLLMSWRGDRVEGEGRAHERGVTVQPKVVYSSQWESEALRESVDASLLMIRATSPGGLRKFALSPVEDRIVKLAKCPVLILRKWA